MQQYNKGFENVKQIAPKMKYNDAQDKEWATTRFFLIFRMSKAVHGQRTNTTGVMSQ